MYQNFFKIICLWGTLFLCTFNVSSQQKIKIACIGNSITYGATIENREINSYPAQLSAILGKDYEVRNFGKNGATLLTKGDHPYILEEEYHQALKFMPDWVFIKLGTNDSKPINRIHLNDFTEDYRRLINSFTQLPSHPRIVLLLPVPVFTEGDKGISSNIIQSDIFPKIRLVAFESGIELINLHSLLIDSPSLFPDGIHPSASGAIIIAKRIAEYIRSTSTVGKRLSLILPKDVNSFNFYGFHGYEFTFNGRQAKIVTPKLTAANAPWVWRARFWGHEPQLDIALLERGFHIVYCDVSELFGNNEALLVWDQFYKFLTNSGLDSKAVMEGMSRGGFYIYRWAVRYPERIKAIYADAPVLDMKSWPGGKGLGQGSPDDWERFKINFNLKNEDEALAFKENPLDLAPQIAKAGYPILHVVGDADDIVPIIENTTPFEKKIKNSGGKIEIIHKPEVGHHPHSLLNPQPIVDFVLKAYLKQH